jgi:dipeptidyl aminopeptidase/acylaminoacyl peptidase
MGGLPFEAFLQVRSAGGGEFSPDGRSLVFLLDDSGAPQVYRLDSPGFEPKQLTHFTEIVRRVHWSPDGGRLLFSMDEGGSEREQLYLLAPDGSECRPLTPHPESIHTFGGWSPDARRIAFGANRRDPAFFDVYVLDVDTGEERCVLRRGGYFVPADWSPDGCRLLVHEQVGGADHNLHLLDLVTGELRLLTPHQGEARYETPRLLPDGRSALVCTDEDRDFLVLARLDLKTGRLQRLLERRADVERCDVSADGRRVVALLNRDGWSEVVTARLRDRALSAVSDTRLPGVATDCRLARCGSPVAVSMSGPAQNENVWAMDPDTTHRVQWTRASMESVGSAELAAPELVRYPTHDGRQIPAFLYRAAGGSGAAVVYVHGGPESQDRPKFNPVYQYLAQCGYLVLAPNVRGSDGYGNAYRNADNVEKRPDALRDVAFAHRWLAESGLADGNRIAVMGASYGGFTVLYCLTHQPELWAAGVDIVGIANFETFFKHTGPWRRSLRATEYGDPEQDRDLLRTLSPIHRTDAIQAPLMVVQGANDPRVPQVESDQMVQRLRERDHPVEYLLFPDEGHGIKKLPNRIKAYTAIGAFLDRYLGR